MSFPLFSILIYASPVFTLGYSELKQQSPTSKPRQLSIVGPHSAANLANEEWDSWNDKLGVPYFVPNQTHTVLAPIGHTTYLHCIVGNLGDRQVLIHLIIKYFYAKFHLIEMI